MWNREWSLYLGVVRGWGELDGSAGALGIAARVFVVGLFPLTGRGGSRLLAGGCCHLEHHHPTAGAGGQQSCRHIEFLGFCLVFSKEQIQHAIWTTVLCSEEIFPNFILFFFYQFSISEFILLEKSDTLAFTHELFFSAFSSAAHLISETPLAMAQLGCKCFDYNSMTRVAITNTLPLSCDILCSDTGDPIILLMSHPEGWIKENKPALTSKWTNKQYFRLIAFFFVDPKLKLGGNHHTADGSVDLWINT